MTSLQLQQWILHPESLNRESLYELRTLVARYPYFQSLRLLYLKNLYGGGTAGCPFGRKWGTGC